VNAEVCRMDTWLCFSVQHAHDMLELLILPPLKSRSGEITHMAFRNSVCVSLEKRWLRRAKVLDASMIGKARRTDPWTDFRIELCGSSPRHISLCDEAQT
jgi:hypothetical protein